MGGAHTIVGAIAAFVRVFTGLTIAHETGQTVTGEAPVGIGTQGIVGAVVGAHETFIGLHAVVDILAEISGVTFP